MFWRLMTKDREKSGGEQAGKITLFEFGQGPGAGISNLGLKATMAIWAVT